MKSFLIKTIGISCFSLFVVFAANFFMTVFIWVISVYSVDEAFSGYAYEEMKKINCAGNVYPAKQSGVMKYLAPFEFILNSDYWLSDYRIMEVDFNKHECLVRMKEIIVSYKNSVKVSVIDEKSNVTYVIVSKKLQD